MIVGNQTSHRSATKDEGASTAGVRPYDVPMEREPARGSQLSTTRG